jgi:glycosyltransferase involved in cell wall biosynthesis
MTSSSTNASVWIVIPAYNEAEVIGKVIRDLLAKQYNVVVIDDFSKDETSRIALQNGAHVLRHIVNLGQGAALQTGISFALNKGAEFIVTFDGDGQHSTEEISRLLAPLRNDDFEVTLGSRFLPGAVADGIPSLRRLMLSAATTMSRATTGLALTDTHNGLRGMCRSAASRIRLTQNRMAHASEFLSQVATHKLRYCEVPVTISYNEYTLAKGQRLSNSFNVMWELMLGFLRL